MTLLAHVAETSRKVSETSSRLDKTRELATCLRTVEPEEIPIAIAYLSGETCQGKVGVSYASLQAAHVAPAAAPSLALRQVDSALAKIAQTKGKGSNERRTECLRRLFAQATADEQDFLVRL